MNHRVRTYSELQRIKTFMERFEYLKLNGSVGVETFGFDRFINQTFYRSYKWLKEVRNYVLLRDNGCDLGILDREIPGRIIIHHMNPITEEDIINKNPDIWNPEFLICTSLNTHNAIHYSDKSILLPDLVERKPNDTRLW